MSKEFRMVYTVYTVQRGITRNGDTHTSKTKLSRGQKIEAILVGVTAFLANAIIMSFVASLAIYNVEFKNYFVKNHEWITFIVIFPTGVFGVVGLLTGIFINKFGVRITGVTGSILLTVGVGACFFARDVFYLLPFLGIFGGTGCSLVYLTISMSMCDYFKNKGRLLMPLITVSEGVGTIISPLLTNYLIDVYGWRGSILLMSGIMFQLTACVFMYSIKKMQPQNGDRKQTGIRSADPSNNEFDHFRFLPDSSLQRRTNVPASLQTDPNSEKQSSHGAGFDPCVSIIPNYKTGDADQNASNSQVSVNDLQNETQKLQIPDLLSNTEAKKSTKAIAEEKTTSSTAIVLSIIKDKQYVLFLISVSIVAGTVHATITILPDFAVSKGLTLTEAANVFSIGASGDIIARLISSLLLYKLKVPSLLIYTIAGILLTVLTVIYPFLAELSLISLLSFFVMLTCGVLFGVYNVIVLDFFDIEKFPIAMGMSETVSGCGIMLVGFLVGHVTEINDGDYTNTYFLLVGLNTVAMLPMIYLYMERIYLYMNKCRRK